MEIESFFPGRIRVRSELFTKPGAMERIRQEIDGMDGIRDLALNPRTGSLTVLYDSSIIDTDTLLRAKDRLEQLESHLAG